MSEKSDIGLQGFENKPVLSISGLVDIDFDSIMFLSFGRFVLSVSGLGIIIFTMSIKTNKQKKEYCVYSNDDNDQG